MPSLPDESFVQLSVWIVHFPRGIFAQHAFSILPFINISHVPQLPSRQLNDRLASDARELPYGTCCTRTIRELEARRGGSFSPVSHFHARGGQDLADLLPRDRLHRLAVDGDLADLGPLSMCIGPSHTR